LFDLAFIPAIATKGSSLPKVADAGPPRPPTARPGYSQPWIRRETRSQSDYCATRNGMIAKFFVDTNVAVTKQRLQMTHDEALAVLQSLVAFPVWPVTRDLVLRRSTRSRA